MFYQISKQQQQKINDKLINNDKTNKQKSNPPKNKTKQQLWMSTKFLKLNTSAVYKNWPPDKLILHIPNK